MSLKKYGNHCSLSHGSKPVLYYFVLNFPSGVTFLQFFQNLAAIFLDHWLYKFGCTNFNDIIKKINRSSKSNFYHDVLRLTKTHPGNLTQSPEFVNYAFLKSPLDVEMILDIF